MKNAHSAESNEKSYIYIFPIFIFGVMTDCIYNLRYTPSVPPTKKKVFKSDKICMKDVHCSKNYILADEFLGATFSLEIWSILYMVDFIVCERMQNQPYLKN